MTDHAFTGPAFTVGIEEELMLVHPDGLDLAQEIEAILAAVPARIDGQVKTELMQSVLEIATRPCDGVATAGEELRDLRRSVVEVAAGLDLEVAAAGTHPFALWEDQRIVEHERYEAMVDYLGYIARTELIFGTHVHVGVDDPEKAIHIADGLRQRVPLMLALSTNSPFWRGERTGMMSTRMPVLRALPRIGIPPHFGTWDEYVERLGRLVRSGAIEDYTRLWWDVRPHPNLGTVEVRAFDQQTDVVHTIAFGALVQSLCHQLAAGFDTGERVVPHPHELIDESKVQAAVRGMEAQLIDLDRDISRPATEVARELLDQLREHAQELGCERELEGVADLVESGTEATRQLARHGDDGDLRALVRELIAASRA